MNRQKELQNKKKAFWKEKMTPLYLKYLSNSQFIDNKNISREKCCAFFEECYSWQIPNLSMEIKQDWKQNCEKIDFYITQTKVLSLNSSWLYRLELLDFQSYIKTDISVNEPQKLYHFLVAYTQTFCKLTTEWQQKQKQFWKEKRQQELAIQYICEILEKLHISHFVKIQPTYFSLHININEQQIEMKLSYDFVIKHIHKALPKLAVLYKLLINSGFEFQIKQVCRDW